MATMSTPISKLAVPTNVPIQVESQDEDPDVQAVLQEVQKPASISLPPPSMASQPVYHPQPVYHQPNIQIYSQPSSLSWIQTEVAKRAMFAAIIASVFFYPKTFEMIYQKVPILSKVIAFEWYIRILLLAVVLYLLMWKLNI